jgi:hypothetical protein
VHPPKHSHRHPPRQPRKRGARRGWRRVGVGSGLVLLCSVLSGCFTADVRLTVSSDDTVSGTAVVAVDRAAAVAAGGVPALVRQLEQRAVPSDVPAPGRVETNPYRDARRVGVRITLTDVGLDAFGGSPEPGRPSLAIVRSGDEFVVSGSIDLTRTGLQVGGDLNTLRALSAADVSVRLTFPGEVLQSNGDVAGRTVAWTARPGEVTTLIARASAVGGSPGAATGTSGRGWTWAVVAGVGVIVLSLVGLLAHRMMRASRRGSGASRHRVG